MVCRAAAVLACMSQLFLPFSFLLLSPSIAAQTPAVASANGRRCYPPFVSSVLLGAYPRPVGNWELMVGVRSGTSGYICIVKRQDAQ